MPGPSKVLLVDDDADWRDAMNDALIELGYQPTSVATGEAALDELRREAGAYAVMLLDLHMPGLSGQEVADRLPPGAPKVVFLTGAPLSEAGSALRKGGHYYLPKGAKLEELSLLLSALAA